MEDHHNLISKKDLFMKQVLLLTNSAKFKGANSPVGRWFHRLCEIFMRRVGNGMLNFHENDGGLAQEQQILVLKWKTTTTLLVKKIFS